MRKLKLEMEALAVESFRPDVPLTHSRGGTVHAHDHTRGHNTCYFSCQVGCTLQESCYNPCTTGLA